MTKWFLKNLPGDGRGTIFWNNDSQFIDKHTGLQILEHEGYDDEDDDFDDFGYQYYTCTVQGTEQQVKDFIEHHFYGKGQYVQVDEENLL